MCGEYVRTISQGIKRIDDININAPINKYKYKTGESDWDGEWYGTIKTTAILKHSTNIIDLIEVGDYVNGHLVEQITGFENGEIFLEFADGKYCNALRKKDTIVTKEQFKAMEYEV